MEYNITTIIQAVFALIAAVITVIVIPYIKSKTTAQQQAEINAWVKIAVSAAEQTKLHDEASGEQEQEAEQELYESVCLGMAQAARHYG